MGTESLGVRGLSCVVEDHGVIILVDPGIALGYNRWDLHPHPLQAVAGDIVRERIKKLWSKANIVVLSHMHGDHVPLYNANPFQLNLYDLPSNSPQRIIAPPIELLRMEERRRLSKIQEIYRENITFVGDHGLKLEFLEVYGPYPHGHIRTPVYTAFINMDSKILHVSDTGLLVEGVVELVKALKPDIVITDGPPIYRYLHNRRIVNSMLEVASRNLAKMTRYADKVIVDHHVHRCDEGYRWVKNIGKEHSGVTSAAEYMLKKPLLLEAWRRTLYWFFPVSNYWFKNEYMLMLNRFKGIHDAIVASASKMKNICEEEFSALLSLIFQ